MIPAPGIYADVPMADYVRDPCPAPSLNHSVAHALLTQSAWHAWHAHPRLNPHWHSDANGASDLGTIAHALLIEGNESAVEVVNADSWRTNEAKAKREAARAAGKAPILVAAYAAVKEMVEAARAALGRSEFDWATMTDTERTIAWAEHGLWLRGRPDWMASDKAVVVDYKTTAGSAQPDEWARGPMYRNGYDLQAALVLRGLAALDATRKPPVFVFAVQETEAPYGLSLVSLSPAYLEFANHRLASAIAQYRYCIENSKWPSYTGRVAYVDPPGWATYQWDVQHDNDDRRPLAEQLGA